MIIINNLTESEIELIMLALNIARPIWKKDAEGVREFAPGLSDTFLGQADQAEAIIGKLEGV